MWRISALQALKGTYQLAFSWTVIYSLFWFRMTTGLKCFLQRSIKEVDTSYSLLLLLESHPLSHWSGVEYVCVRACDIIRADRDYKNRQHFNWWCLILST